MGVCDCSMFCCTLLYVHSGFPIISMAKRELIALLLFLVSRDCCVVLPHDATGLSVQFLIVLFLDHTHLLFLIEL